MTQKLGCFALVAIIVAQSPAQSQNLETYAPSYTLEGGAGLYFLAPLFGSNPAYLTRSNVADGAGGSLSRSQTSDLNWDFELSSRYWLALRLDESWGVRARFWHLDQESPEFGLQHAPDVLGTETIVTTAGVLPIVSTPLLLDQPATRFTIASDLKLDVWDFEGTYRTTWECWRFEGAVGIRYADLRQSYRADAVNPGDPALAFAPLEQHQRESTRFHGLGATLAAEVGYHLFGGLSLFTSGRASALVGQSRQRAWHQRIDPTGEAIFETIDSRTVMLPVGELELGMEWARQLGRAGFFVQGALVGQSWWGAGSPTIPAGGRFASTTAGANPSPFQVLQASSTDLNFAGFSLRMGLSY